MTEETRKIHDDRVACVGNVGNDGILNTGVGRKNTYITYTTVTGVEEKTVIPLNDFLEIEIGGVTYRVKSVFADKGQMGDLLDLAAMEKINRIA